MRLYTYLLEKIILPLGSIISGNSFSTYLSYLRRCDNMSAFELEAVQKEKLDKLLKYVLTDCEYYKSYGIKEKEDPYLTIKEFPILTKNLLRENESRLLTRPVSKLIRCSSSGSSGLRTSIYLTKKELGIPQATQLHWWNWAGYHSGEKLLQTGITPSRGFVKKIKDICFNTIYVPAFSLTEQQVVEILKSVKRGNYTLAGYASSLYVFACAAREQKIHVTFKRALSWGDKLFEHYRKEIRDVFNCEVYDTYGCSEGMLMAAQKDLPYMYIMTPNVYIEIVDDEGNEVPDGTMGHVLVTNLNGYAMPLIRYKLGDLAVKLPLEKYPDKRKLNYPLLERVIGRDTDLVKTKSGKIMIVHTFTGIFEFYRSIKQFRVIQTEMEGIDIEYIPSETFADAELMKIANDIYERTGESRDSFYINFKRVDYIPPTSSGKPQIIKSLLGNKL